MLSNLILRVITKVGGGIYKDDEDEIYEQVKMLVSLVQFKGIFEDSSNKESVNLRMNMTAVTVLVMLMK